MLATIFYIVVILALAPIALVVLLVLLRIIGGIIAAPFVLVIVCVRECTLVLKGWMFEALGDKVPNSWRPKPPRSGER